MTSKYTWTPESFAKLHSLRADGLSQAKIGRLLGVSDSVVFKALHPEKKRKPKPAPITKAVKPNRKARPASLLLPREIHHGSCPIHRPLNSTTTKLPQVTKEQMYYDLAQAVRNTH